MLFISHIAKFIDKKGKSPMTGVHTRSAHVSFVLLLFFM